MCYETREVACAEQVERDLNDAPWAEAR